MMAENVNSNIDVVEARRLIETVTTLAKTCSFTRLEAMKIVKVCMDCIDRIESEE